MKEIRIVSTSDWLPIQYEQRGKMKEPYVMYDDNKILIRDIINIDGKPNVCFIDVREYINEYRFPRFIEISVEADRIRFWKVVNEEEDNSEFLKKDLHEVFSLEAAKALSKAGIHTVEELLDSSDETIRAAMSDDYTLYVDTIGLMGVIENTIKR